MIDTYLFYLQATGFHCENYLFLFSHNKWYWEGIINATKFDLDVCADMFVCACEHEVKNVIRLLKLEILVKIGQPIYRLGVEISIVQELFLFLKVTKINQK